MFFLLRTAFWLSIVILLLPAPESMKTESGVGAAQAVSAASATFSDMSQFCSRQPDACQIGSQARQVQSSRDAQQIVQQEASDARDAVSGVNLDEEAANLIKYQQAYQAAAQMIRVASSLFDSILAATSR